jgi:HAD superfamily hydrolase (TIGR01509 family)
MSKAARHVARIPEVRGVVFDLDGVLLDSEPLHFRAACRVFREEGRTLSESAYREWIGRGALDTWTDWKKRHGLAADVQALIAADERARFEEIGCGIDPIPEAVELARRLASAGMPLAIASSSTPKTIDAELAALGLDDVFDTRVSGEHVKRPKPAPDVYLRAADRLGLPPQACLAIEDSPVGVAAAKGAEMTCIAVPTRWTLDGDFRLADITLRSLRYFPLLVL